MNRRKLFFSTAKAAITAALGGSWLFDRARAQTAPVPHARGDVNASVGGTEIPRPSAPFKGIIGKTFKESKADFPQPFKAPKGAPNILVILLDDVGFGHPGTFGGPIPTPKLDELAGKGVRFNTFHSTGICSPSRAAVLTGLNHHQVGFGTIAELSTGYPGYDSVWPLEASTVAEVLKQNGYSTAAWGKWHNTPDWETTPMGPFTRWPTGEGFEYWYGFHGGETSQWEPQLFRNTLTVEPPKRPEQGYHLTEDIVDDAIHWINREKSVTPDKPFFIYFAPGAAHAPLHVPDEWIEKFKGQFDRGWDKVREETLARQKRLGVVPPDTLLTPRPKEIESWDSLSPDAKRLYARHMETFAGFLAHTDYHLGRLTDAINALPDKDNTLIFYIAGDNGPSAEGSITGTLNNMMTQSGIPDTVERQLAVIDEIGGPLHENHYPVGWSWAGSAPFQWMKRVPSHFGGTRNGMVVTWPAHLKEKGGLRTQFHHVIDIVPTIYEAVGIQAPTKVNGITQKPIAGVSLLYSLNDSAAPSTRHVQYFETGGHRAIYQDGWVATAFHGVPWMLTGSVGNFDADKWELYNCEKDFSEAIDLAEKMPEKLKAMQALFDEQALKYDVYPLDDRFVERAINPDRPSVAKGRTSFTYTAGVTRIPEGSAPQIYQRSHRITASIVVPADKTEGVIVATGGGSAGYTLYVKGGKVVYEYNFFGKARYRVVSDITLPTGNVEVVLDYTQKPFKQFVESTGGPAKLFINGKQVGEGDIANVTPGRFSATETLDIGMDLGSTVSMDYRDKAPFAFTGIIKTVKIDLT